MRNFILITIVLLISFSSSLMAESKLTHWKVVKIQDLDGANKYNLSQKFIPSHFKFKIDLVKKFESEWDSNDEESTWEYGDLKIVLQVLGLHSPSELADKEFDIKAYTHPFEELRLIGLYGKAYKTPDLESLLEVAAHYLVVFDCPRFPNADSEGVAETFGKVFSAEFAPDGSIDYSHIKPRVDHLIESLNSLVTKYSDGKVKLTEEDPDHFEMKLKGMGDRYLKVSDGNLTLRFALVGALPPFQCEFVTKAE